MVHDFWMHRDDPEYVRGFLPGIRAVLGWFEQRVDDTGLLGGIPWWPYMDWAPEWRGGVPPGGREGHSTLISLLYAYSLERAAELEDALGRAGNASAYREDAQSVLEAVRRHTWDAERSLFKDTPDGDTYSQQVNVMAILTGAVPEAERAGLMERLLSDSSLTQSTYYFSYYQLEALLESGLGERYLEQLAPWQEMLALGLTTVPETPEPTRSDSHAWSAHPNYGLLATVLGVRPGEPGFRSVRITPHLGSLERAEGVIPHPAGNIEVRLSRKAGGGLSASVTLPEGLEGVLDWGGQETPLVSGAQDLEL
jgi:hypothetical protein